eukprot:CAMPEP_0201244132 /NCGR_PEP_ID=MMETSP0852-20130820/43752_1 /ASSEMBLY_ACC=CAM_ASM_000632 /TAXON_ID=183588 /ORGANISM="Pseudo-nitzschia fraudulenta, Strain WWA7" /LENGTH=51 /DNA_ID=CAMNT_0047541453 /DNA_START=260 /DNA_END=415 /DNA_ORIENTATION=-
MAFFNFYVDERNVKVENAVKVEEDAAAFPSEDRHPSFPHGQHPAFPAQKEL